MFCYKIKYYVLYTASLTNYNSFTIHSQVVMLSYTGVAISKKEARLLKVKVMPLLICCLSLINMALIHRLKQPLICAVLIVALFHKLEEDKL